ncbi:hypothetical protein DEH84_13860 [Aquabacterium olei]|uniref:Alpha-1,2-fucosyltransferase n=1 Tax=Aquabacterium olei TaxID=1296669 RepID=A0A2U8FUC7_9BURK|nr:alpha-1,2-fucosyltransferase [Aquabacterium olei]AWI54388.1 hypothetical protein DEH84_13860 [Aquabacterium olei]
MIYVRLAGGLGNQLFQTAAALLLAASEERQIVLVPNGLTKYASVRGLDIARLLDFGKIKQLSIASENSLGAALIDKLRIGRWLPFLSVTDAKFSRLCGDGRSMPSLLFLDGYYQSGWDVKELLRIADIIKAAIPHSGGQEPRDGDVIGVHVRGGDFLNVPLHKVVDEKYYFHAIKDLIEVQGAGRELCCITDDPDYARAVLRYSVARFGLQFSAIERPSSDLLDDFRRLGAFRFCVIGNSTFSFWGYLLGSGPLSARVLVSPKQFTNKRDRDFLLPGEVLLDAKNEWRRTSLAEENGL